MKPMEAAWSVLKQDSMSVNEAINLANRMMMEKYNPEGMAGVSMDFNTIPEYQQEYRQLINSLMLGIVGLPTSRQTTLPPELTSGATVGTKDFRDVKFPNFSGR